MTVGFLLRRIDCNDGVASHLETLMRGLKTAGVEVVLLTGPVHRKDVAAERFNSLASLSKEWVILDLPITQRAVNRGAARQLAAAIARLKIQLLHLHGVSTLPLARLATLGRRIPTVATAHPSGTSTRGPGRKVKEVIRLTAPILRRMYLPDSAIAISSDLQNWFTEDLRMEPSRVHLVPHGIDASHFRPPTTAEREESRDHFGLGVDELVISLVGRYEPVKRHDLLIDAAASVFSASDNVRLLLTGSGGYAEQISKMVQSSPLSERIRLFGPVKDARTAYWASDIFVLPSDREGFGLAAAEAMMCGVIPIRTATAGAVDQISDGVNGFMIPIGDRDMLARRLEWLRDNPSRRPEMQNSAAHFARSNFTTEIMVKKTLEAYLTLLDAKATTERIAERRFAAFAEE